MSTTSTNFSLVLATTSDTVNVVTQIANNFSSLDSIVGVAHTGTGELKNSLTFVTPTLNSPTVSGTMAGGNITATTATFATVTATGGAFTADSFSIGTYAFPGTVGSTGQILAVETGNLVFQSNTPGTGANENLSNLASVAINTNLQNFTASQVTLAQVIATSAQLTGISSFSATTGTFSSNVTISGTATIDVVNCTGGAITAGGLAVGTYSYPGTVGTTNQVLTVTTGNAQWIDRDLAQTSAYFSAFATAPLTASAEGFFTIPFSSERFDTVSQFDTAANTYTVTASGFYLFTISALLSPSATSGTISAQASLYLNTDIPVAGVFIDGVSGDTGAIGGSVLVQATSGDTFVASLAVTAAGGLAAGQKIVVNSGEGRSFFTGMKVPDS